MSKVKKISLVYSEEESSWVSCQTIVANIVQLYRETFPGVEFESFEYSADQGEYNYFCSLERLTKFSPDALVICDHKPPPDRLIMDLVDRFGVDRVPMIYCHVFGDFSLCTNNWLNIESYLKELKIKFIAASHRQQNFVRQFMKSGEDSVSYLPFPVNGETYRFSQEGRVRARKSLGWSGDAHKKFLYTGRMTAQKNVILLVKLFGEFLKLSGSDANLYLAGEFDDLGYPFFGSHDPQGLSYYQFLEATKESEDKLIKERVHFLGNISQEELIDYYQACDIFVSLSLHNDEDYGMSPAEAVCCGMPIILSNWGGYTSFKIPDFPGSLVNVSLMNSFYTVDAKNFIKLLFKYDQSNYTDSERREYSILANKEFSISGNKKRLLSIYNEPIKKFSGWNKKFQDFSNCFKRDRGNPFGILSIESSEDSVSFGQRKVRTRKIYRDCYSEYIS